MSKSWKVPLYLLLFGVLTIISVFWKNFGQKTYTPAEISGSNNGNLQIFVQPETGHQPIIDAINGASSEILVEVYLLSDKEVLSVLEEAHTRGVKVQIMMEQHPFGGGNVNETSSTRLQSDGIDFKWTNPTFALTHAKFIVVDRKILWVMDQNLTAAAFKSNREYDIEDPNPDDTAEAVQIFNADWNRTGYTPVAKDLVVSPDNSRGKLEALINSATKSIDVEMEIYEDNDMINLLAASSKKLAVSPDKIGVRVIAPDLGKVPSNKQDLDTLKTAGVQVKTLSSPYIHAKLILVDGQRAYTGSVNLSTASLEQNRELGILVSQGDIVAKMGQTFEGDWANGVNY